MGFYAYGGYDTKAGWIAGVGWGFGSSSSGWSYGSNMTSVGVSWSQRGGVSGNVFGFQVSQNGIEFDPSWSVSYNLSIEYVKNDYVPNTEEPCRIEESCFKTKAEALADLKERGFKNGSYSITEFDYKERSEKDYNDYLQGKPLQGGYTRARYINGKLDRLKITMHPHKTPDGFYESFNHELIHAYDHVKYGMFTSRFESYTETKAYMWTDRYRSKSTMPGNIPVYGGELNLFDIPNYLVPTQIPMLQMSRYPVFTIPRIIIW